MTPRKRWMLQPMTWRRGGLAALVILVLFAGVALLLDSGAEEEYAPIVDALESDAVAPIDLVVSLGRTSQILLLSDVRGRAEPKRLAAEAVGRLVEGPGLDAVVLAVPSTEQPYIDAYLDESSASLLDRPRAIQEEHGMPGEYLRIYEAVREANRGLSPSRRVRIIAADKPDWPPTAIAPRAVADGYAGRAEHMLDRIDRELFSLMPEARILVFVDGYLALQGTYGRIELGAGQTVRVEWLGTLLRQRSGAAARTVLLDTGPRAEPAGRSPAYHGTVLHRPLRRAVGDPAGARVRGALAAVVEPIPGHETPGFAMRILPGGYTLGDVAQGYVFLNDR